MPAETAPGHHGLTPTVIRSLEMLHLSDLKRQVERILGWEPARYWQSSDFTQLSNKIFAYTYHYVSARDLQRFWQGPPAAVPHPPLLDTLAQFIDFRDWEDFCTHHTYGIIETGHGTIRPYPRVWEVPTRWVLILWSLSVLASILTAVLLVWFR
ncbi:hypothetical protein [Fibrisoma montanum]|uniref:hypothetical protein n=1 Tax=Fibrisoma montanum TaxID=2305895 RepID=UPI0011C22437|nr:hypothetical protein [Fibrisoma montanum]